MNSGIYKWTSPSGKSYIGQSINLKRRKKEFLSEPEHPYTGKNTAIDFARRKYSDYSKWSYEILEYSESKEILNQLEEEYIRLYNTTDRRFGYNISTGGAGSKGVHWGSPKQIESARSRDISGKNNPHYGKHHSEETKKLLSEQRKGKKASFETIKKSSKPVNQYSMDGKFIKTWIGAAQVEKELGIFKSAISAVCRGKKKSAGGFKWCFSDEA